MQKKIIDKFIPMPKNTKYVIHDHWIGIVASLNGKFAYIPEKYIKYRQHGNNQIGTDKFSHKFKKLEDVRKLFLDVKLDTFNVYVENNNVFPENIRKTNIEALEYFKMLNNKKNFNFKKWNVFYKLYKTEKFGYYMENFLIMNMPVIAKILFKIRYVILKIMRKR